MNHQVLARKWRPKHFDTIAGQDLALRALQNALEQNRLHHAYLFTGTRGVGKTTLARVLAKSLMCEKGISANPCGVCDICQDIDAGRMVDLIEVDAASRTKVEDTRELLENVQYMPTRARFKIYLIDEVHMLSTHSFNALLKTLEEPPAHVKFLLATTDPQKLPVTVLSRCLQFHLKNLSTQKIADYLAHILQTEKIAFEQPALVQIAKAANGSMRDALSLLDQAIAFGNQTVNQQDVSQMLGTISQDSITTILNPLSAQDGETLLQAIQQLAEKGYDFNHVLEALISALHHIALQQTITQITYIDSLLNQEEALHYATLFSKEDIQLYYQIALIGKRDLALAPTARMGIEMTLLRMLAFKPNDIAYTPSENKKPAASIKPIQTDKATKTQTITQPQSPLNDWDNLIEQLNISGPTKLLASHCTMRAFENNQLELILSAQYSALLNERIQERLSQALDAHLQRKCKLIINIGQPEVQTPAEKADKKQSQEQAILMNTLQNDTQLQTLMKTFDVTLKPEMVNRTNHS